MRSKNNKNLNVTKVCHPSRRDQNHFQKVVFSGIFNERIYKYSCLKYTVKTYFFNFLFKKCIWVTLHYKIITSTKLDMKKNTKCRNLKKYTFLIHSKDSIHILSYCNDTVFHDFTSIPLALTNRHIYTLLRIW